LPLTINNTLSTLSTDNSAVGDIILLSLFVVHIFQRLIILSKNDNTFREAFALAAKKLPPAGNCPLRPSPTRHCGYSAAAVCGTAYGQRVYIPYEIVDKL
jgi:hypothetical protein